MDSSGLAKPQTFVFDLDITLLYSRLAFLVSEAFLVSTPRGLHSFGGRGIAEQNQVWWPKGATNMGIVPPASSSVVGESRDCFPI